MFKVIFAENSMVLTHIKGNDIKEVETYCKENNLTIVETVRATNKYLVNVYCEEPNQRFQVLRKRKPEIPGWHLVEACTTKKWAYYTYEKDLCMEYPLYDFFIN